MKSELHFEHKKTKDEMLIFVFFLNYDTIFNWNEVEWEHNVILSVSLCVWC